MIKKVLDIITKTLAILLATACITSLIAVATLWIFLTLVPFVIVE